MRPQNYPQSPKNLWEIFFQLTQIPRPSKHETKAIEYLKKLANDFNLNYVVDQANNVILYVPGKNGRENDPPVIIQNHIDMVTDATKGHEIDFLNDPLSLEVDGEWLKAVGTTLGADNGIGCAAALAVLFEQKMKHPPLELLFTVDEETGLNGALGLESKYLTGKKMLNLDTEEWGSLYIGCAGGIDYELTREYGLVEATEGFLTYRLDVKGFLGGHSGVDIHQQRGNALKFLAELLASMQEALDFEIIEIRGGRAHNIIPREAFVNLKLRQSDENKVINLSNELKQKWLSYLPQTDKSLEIDLTQLDPTPNEKVLKKEDQARLISYLILFPHGAHAYDLNDNSLVSMSNNFAKFLCIRGQVYTQSSLRFFDRNEVERLEQKVRSLGEVFEMKVKKHSEYPSWKPVRENSVLDLVKDVYKKIYNNEPEVTAIHAGLECGILRDKIGEIDVVSFGPTITGAHSPDERVYIPSVEKFWDLFKRVLEEI